MELRTATTAADVRRSQIRPTRLRKQSRDCTVAFPGEGRLKFYRRVAGFAYDGDRRNFDGGMDGEYTARLEGGEQTVGFDAEDAELGMQRARR